MEGNDVSSDHVIAELVEMGFEFPLITEAIEAVGPSLDNAIDFILNPSQRQKKPTPLNGSTSSTSNAKTLGKRGLSASSSLPGMKQSSITEHLQSSSRPKRLKTNGAPGAFVSGLKMASKPMKEKNPSLSRDCDDGYIMNTSTSHISSPRVKEIGPDWEKNVNYLLKKHFGFASLKSFQKKALEAWLANEDCLVLAATGSGKSLCFQIPALLSGKVVVVISPLISLMHDQCLKLAEHGVSACFLGSGQSDSSVEQKALNGMYDVVYVCPETVVRLIQPLQRLAENRGIALFAIDEVHCVSKWGHDFRPDYRRLSILRENFRAGSLKSVESDIPLMALTATATIRVREDILQSLHMSQETKIILTSFFRPNLRFSVKHSVTTSMSSYEKDFRELIDVYATNRVIGKKELPPISHESEDELDSFNSFNGDDVSLSDLENTEDEDSDGNDAEPSSINGSCAPAPKEKQMSVEYLEDELDVFQSVDDFDVACGEFRGCSSNENEDTCEPSGVIDLMSKPEERIKFLERSLEHGPTIIYVPTRKETLRLAQYLNNSGVMAAPYNAKLPKTHLRRVHKDFHDNAVEVIVATIAFGMGIDKSNVRRIIHYGWPQSLEAYYQEAGRAGRDGKLADCILYANLSRIPTLLPSQRSEEQTKQAYRMLSDCFRYGMGTATCRAKTLVEYFGEDFSYEKCLLCDVCVSGPPELQNLKEEANIFIRVLASNYAAAKYEVDAYDNVMCRGRFIEKANLRSVICSIREQFSKFAASDRIWWQGLSRILEDKGYIREGADLSRVCIKFPEPTALGLRFLQSESENVFDVYPEADMLLAVRNPRSYSTFSDWGRGWADPEIRRQRLQGNKLKRKSRKKRSRRHHKDLQTVRGRLAAKLLKPK